MSVLNSHTTADYLEWDVMLNLIRKLYRDGDYRMSLFIGAGCFFGLRVSDLRKLTWSMLLDDDKFVINEQKTSKRRVVKSILTFRSTYSSVMMHSKSLTWMRLASYPVRIW